MPCKSLSLKIHPQISHFCTTVFQNTCKGQLRGFGKTSFEFGPFFNLFHVLPRPFFSSNFKESLEGSGNRRHLKGCERGGHIDRLITYQPRVFVSPSSLNHLSSSLSAASSNHFPDGILL